MKIFFSSFDFLPIHFRYLHPATLPVELHDEGVRESLFQWSFTGHPQIHSHPNHVLTLTSISSLFYSALFVKGEVQPRERPSQNIQRLDEVAPGVRLRHDDGRL